jgi:hypothetical protein
VGWQLVAGGLRDACAPAEALRQRAALLNGVVNKLATAAKHVQEVLLRVLGREGVIRDAKPSKVATESTTWPTGTSSSHTARAFTHVILNEASTGVTVIVELPHNGTPDSTASHHLLNTPRQHCMKKRTSKLRLRRSS